MSLYEFGETATMKLVRIVRLNLFLALFGHFNLINTTDTVIDDLVQKFGVEVSHGFEK